MSESFEKPDEYDKKAFLDSVDSAGYDSFFPDRFRTAHPAGVLELVKGENENEENHADENDS